ncbi:thioredoxin family protein [Polaribacter sp. HaHaR_3_91]|uniref:thioredoxin family protein n=1 Tax=Polaribacter sp. HaHaR_3_91 TaxID=2745561 RepID=UPI001C4ED2AA|nr:thioredoxin family protein [Polaribacter sp. HaHaR_3_91]QXP64086.1 thioredoxin family protein [Polaribacter sp. HaHaR_3_91]
MKNTLLFFFILSTCILYGQKNNTLLNYSFEEAFKLQEKEKKPIIVFFHTSWCKYCFAMKKNTFIDKKVINLLNKHFYFVSFDAESKDFINIKGRIFKNKSGVHQIVEVLASKNNTISYPSTIIISTNNTIDEQIDSFLSAEEITKILTSYIALK